MTTPTRPFIDDMLCTWTDPYKGSKSKKSIQPVIDLLRASSVKVEGSIGEFNRKLDDIVLLNNSVTGKIQDLEDQIFDKIQKIKGSFLSLKEKNCELEERIKVLEQDKVKALEAQSAMSSKRKALFTKLDEMKQKNIHLEMRIAQIEALVLHKPSEKPSLMNIEETDEEFIVVKELDLDAMDKELEYLESTP